jgi:hypothetical protein
VFNPAAECHLQECVRRRAVLSVRANPACPDEATAQRAVNEVWESCFSDTRPFDEVSFAAECLVVTKAHSCSDILEEHAAVQLYPHS